MNCSICPRPWVVGCNGSSNDPQPAAKPLSLYTRAEVIELIREAMMPQNRFSRVDAALDIVSRRFKRVDSASKMAFDELRTAILVERGMR